MLKRIRVGLDAHMVGTHETGNETYVLGLMDGLGSITDGFELYVYHTGNMRADSAGNRVHYERLLTGSPYVRLTYDLPTRLRRDRIDVMHMSYTAPVWAPCPVVLAVHDISYASHPEWFSIRDLAVLSRAVPWSIKRAARVTTVSEMCRREIIERYQVPEEKVVCVYAAAGPAAQTLSEAEARAEVTALGLDPDRQIVLAVGNLQPRKNLIRLMQAFDRITERGIDADLVIVGPSHYAAELVRRAASTLHARVRFTGYLSHRQLAACYAVATVFAFPSMYEGFGIPALEAMAHGTPVASARAGALPEVCADAAVYFDPLDVDSIAEAVERLLNDPGLRAELSRAGRVRNQLFSWRRAAEETLALFRTAVRSRAISHT